MRVCACAQPWTRGSGAEKRAPSHISRVPFLVWGMARSTLYENYNLLRPQKRVLLSFLVLGNLGAVYNRRMVCSRWRSSYMARVPFSISKNIRLWMADIGNCRAVLSNLQILLRTIKDNTVNGRAAAFDAILSCSSWSWRPMHQTGRFIATCALADYISWIYSLISVHM